MRDTKKVLWIAPSRLKISDSQFEVLGNVSIDHCKDNVRVDDIMDAIDDADIIALGTPNLMLKAQLLDYVGEVKPIIVAKYNHMEFDKWERLMSIIELTVPFK